MLIQTGFLRDLNGGLIQMGCIVLCRTFHTSPEQGQGPEKGREEWVTYPFSGLKTLSGAVSGSGVF